MISFSRVRGVGAFGGLIALALSGCGEDADNLPRKAVSGTVTLDGKPIAKGLIQFVPGQPGMGIAAATGEIAEGKFTIPRDRGPVAGGYKVVINAPDPSAPPTPTEEAPGSPPKPAADLIPPQYNANSTLNSEVKDGGSNVFDYALKSK